MASLVLRAVHRRIGVAQQFLGAGVVRRGQRDTDGRRGEDLLGAQAERRLQLRDDAFGDMRRRLRIGDAFHQHGELVATEAGHHVAGLQAGAHATTHLEEQVVANQVAYRVVDDLEAIQVDEQHREQLARVFPVVVQRLLQALEQQRAIG